MKIQIDPKIVVEEAHREGYEAEIRNGRTYFTGVVWLVDIGEIIQRKKLAVNWNNDHEVCVAGNGFSAQGRNLEEAVLIFVATQHQ
jgi:hypothetical protein